MAVDLKAVSPRAAIDALITRGKELHPTFAWQEVYAEIHGTMFTVAKSAGFDILEDIFNGLLAALEEGKTYREFAAELTPLLQEKGWWGRQIVPSHLSVGSVVAQLGSARRLQLIFDVNMRVSYAAGHWTSFERNKATRPYLRYVHMAGQENPRLRHQAWHNVCLPIDHPWWATHACPNGWNCHCTLQSLSRRDVDNWSDALPLRMEPPAQDLREWVNKVTGDVRHIDQGIDPGWDHNPGKSGWAPTLDRLAAKPDPLGIR